MNLTINQIIPIVIALVIAVVVIAQANRKKATPQAQPPANPMDPQAWEIGPIDTMGNASVGVPLHPLPHPEGWYIDIPQPTADAGHVHYLTVPTGPLTGKTKVTLRCRLEAAPGVRLVPRNFPASPSLLTLFLQRSGDNWSARGEFEAYRWWASFATVRNLGPGEYEVQARFDQNWTAIETSSRNSNLKGFQAAVDNAGRIGFTLGGGDGLGHGVYATGPARLVVTEFEVV